jgi:hypothetical protein
MADEVYDGAIGIDLGELTQGLPLDHLRRGARAARALWVRPQRGQCRLWWMKIFC